MNVDSDAFVLFQSVLFFYAKVLSEGSRLGITTVISTDSIRHMMRSFVDEKQNPLIWASTCHAGECFDRVAVGEANFIGKLISSKTVRKELRKHQRVAAERMCDICQHNVLPGKDVATLMNIRPGGDPLDFRLANAASHSVQSTSLTDQQPEQFVISEAKCSFALADSPPGDSVESSGRPGVPLAYEPNSADNLMLFDGENSIPTGDGSLFRSNKET
ncbi:hypothetical protein AgCh_015565 [Apium graveolens]